MPLSFRYEPKPARVLFGSGSLAELAGCVEALGGRRVFVVSTAGQKRLAVLAADKLGALAAATFPSAVMHTPVSVTETALAALRAAGADCIVAIGGGSAIGLGKALALRTGLPQVAIPTTYAGSEMTDILGETRDGAKTTRRSPEVLPEIVIYDVDLTLDLPAMVTAASGMNAIAHAVEALYAADANPATALMAEDGIRRLAASLPALMDTPRDVARREAAQLGAWLCGLCLANAAMALHHKLCHTLGGSFGLPHAETHAAILPHAAAYNSTHAPEAMAAIGRALGGGDAPGGLDRLKRRLVGSLSLADLGLKRDDIGRAAEIACASPYPNPRPLEREAIRRLIENAWSGAPPRS